MEKTSTMSDLLFEQYCRDLAEKEELLKEIRKASAIYPRRRRRKKLVKSFSTKSKTVYPFIVEK